MLLERPDKSLVKQSLFATRAFPTIGQHRDSAVIGSGGMGTATNPAKLPVELAGHAYVWGHAVALEAERLMPTEADREAATRFMTVQRHADCYLLVLAMRQVLLSAEAMSKAVNGDEELKKALDQFLDESPNAKKMRDVLSHFDEYEAGKGKLQKSGEVGEVLIWLGVGEDSVTLSLASNLMVELSEASAAAVALADATLEAKDRYLIRFCESRESAALP